MNKVLSDERLGAKLRVIENRCILFNSLAYVDLLNGLANKYGTNNIGIYRDDGLAISKYTTEPQSERTRKEIARRFKKHGLKITI